MKNIRWEDFEYYSRNPQTDFEDFARMFFQLTFFNKIVNLVQGTNNPGLETEPIKIGDVNVGFQAKYFSNNVNYDDLVDSCNKIIKYYKGKVNKVIFYCNKDFSARSKKLLDIKSNLESNSISYEFVCNKNILNKIETDEKFSFLLNYFNGYLENLRFKEWADVSLSDIGPRYTSGFHVPVHKEEELHAFFKDEKFFDNILLIFDNFISKLDNFRNVPISLMNSIYNSAVLLKNCVKNDFDSLLKSKEILLTYIDNIDLLLKEKLENHNEKDNQNSSKENLFEFVDLKEKLNDLYGTLKYYIEFVFNKIMIVDGDAGYGKTHLLGYFTEMSLTSELSKIVLFLGHKFLENSRPQKQMIEMLDFNGNFDDFITALDFYGETHNCIVTLIIDGINESEYSKIWKSYLNELLNKINCTNHVKIIISIRDTYKERCFSDNIYQLIDEKKIREIKLSGFRHNLQYAIPAFFNFYNIALNVDSFLNRDFENPLILKLFCDSYTDRNPQNRSLLNMYYSFINKEEDKILSENNIKISRHQGKKIIRNFANILLRDNVYYILDDDLYECCDDIPNSNLIIEGFVKAGVFLDYLSGDKTYLCVAFEKLTEFVIADAILESCGSFDELNTYINENFINFNRGFLYANSAGIFGALSVLCKEKFDRELIECIHIDSIDDFILTNYIGEYLRGYRYRNDNEIIKNDFFDKIYPFIQKLNLYDYFIDCLIDLSTRNCELNAETLLEWTNKFNLAEKDFYFTIHINEKFESSEFNFSMLDFAKNINSNFNLKEVKNLLILLILYLSSSNRQLRDNSSKAIIKIFSLYPELIVPILSKFINNVDPYITSRLFGCVYGGVIKSYNEDKLNKHISLSICDFIYENVFKNIDKFVDILLRDYATNTLDFLIKTFDLNCYDLHLIMPPYKTSLSIPKLDKKEVAKKYINESGSHSSGTEFIKMSMSPELSIEGFSPMYGDFGRYVFDSSLRNFSGYKTEEVFLYAFNYIIDVLGYKNELFTSYDTMKRRYRGDSKTTERIGKKYEWIAMYHTLALVADNYSYSEKYTDYETNKYQGAWRPYIRDFDPTLFLESNDRCYALDIELWCEKYNNWLIGDDNWSTINEPKNVRKHLQIKDNFGNEWICLKMSNSEKTKCNFEKNRSLWFTSTCCLIEKKNFLKFINATKKISFYGRWFDSAEVSSRYNVFIGEYCWSRAFDDEYGSNIFRDAQILDGKTKEKRIVPKLIKIPNELKSSLVISNEPEFIEVQKYKNVGKMCSCHYEYLWEEEYDYSKEETVRILCPSIFFVDKLNLKQRENGIWYCENELACADFSFVKNSNVSGLYIKRKFFDKALGKKYVPVWIGLGEKIESDNYWVQDNVKFLNSSSLCYEKENGEFEEIDIYEKRH